MTWKIKTQLHSLGAFHTATTSVQCEIQSAVKAEIDMKAYLLFLNLYPRFPWTMMKLISECQLPYNYFR